MSRSIVACGLLVVAAACSESTAPISGTKQGAVRVTATTTGVDLPSADYTVIVDSGGGQAVPVNGEVTLSGLRAGNHTVTLYGAPPNCALSGADRRVVKVSAGDTAQVPFNVGCTAMSGAIRISTITTGVDLDPDGYRVSVNGGAEQLVGVNAAVVVPGLNPGSDTVTIAGIALNCTVNGTNPRSVEVVTGDTIDVPIVITCAITALNGEIAFTGSQGGSSGINAIYVINADGSSPMRLSKSPADDRGPAWSPDGTKIAFTSHRDGNDEIYVMNADGSSPTRLTNDPAFDLGPTWSPDGTKIAFTSNRDGTPAIYFMNADGTGVTKIVGDSLFGAFGAAWSPNGASLTFTLYTQDDGGYGYYWIVTMNADGTNWRTVAGGSDLSGGFVSSPAWSPDGTQIAFVRGGVVSVMDADGSKEHTLDTGTENNDSPVWSPDGTRIAFAGICLDACSGASDVYVMNADGSGVTRVTDNLASSYTPAWRPVHWLEPRLLRNVVGLSR